MTSSSENTRSGETPNRNRHESAALVGSKYQLEVEPEPMEKPRTFSSMKLPIRTAPTVLANPRHMEANAASNASKFAITGQAQLSQRALTTFRGGLIEPPTDCWALLRHEPYTHVLLCNHEVVTESVLPCGSQCRLSPTAETKCHGDKIPCKKCTAAWERRIQQRKDSVSIFMPTKRDSLRRSKRLNKALEARSEAVRGGSSFVGPDESTNNGVNGLSTKRQQLSSGAKFSRNSATSGPDPGIKTDPALQKLVKELNTNTKNQAKLMPREILNLQVDGTDVLRFKDPRPKKVRTLAADPFFAAPDREFGEAPDERKSTDAYHKKAARKAVPPMKPAHKEIYCICGNPWDSSLRPCDKCHVEYHPECLGKESPDSTRGVGKKQKRERFLCFECEQKELLASLSKDHGPKSIAHIRKATIAKRDQNRALQRLIEREKKAEQEAKVKKDRESKDGGPKARGGIKDEGEVKGEDADGMDFE